MGEPEAVSSQMKECDDLRGGSHDIPGICLSPVFDSVGFDGFRETCAREDRAAWYEVVPQ